MGQSIPRWPMTGRVWHLAEVLSRMLDRLGVAGAAARLDGGDALREARARCHDCTSSLSCEQFLDAAELRAPFPPFCPNAPFLQRCLDAKNAQTGPSRQP